MNTHYLAPLFEPQSVAIVGATERPGAIGARFTQVDYDREMALIAVVPEGARERQIGVCRYIINPDGISCEFAVVVAEAWQGRGLASMQGEILAANSGMLDLVCRLGFTIAEVPGVPTVKEATLALPRQRA